MPDMHAAAILDAARARAGWAVDELWLRYYSLGGTATYDEVTAFLSGAVPTSDAQYDVLAQALNDEFVGRGLNHPVPYAEDLEAG